MSAPPPKNTLLEFDGVSSRRWDRTVVEDLSWSFRQGESWAVIGPNGAGKSTLAGLILDQIPYFRGSIHREGLVSGIRGIVRVSFEQHQKLIRHEEGKDHYEAFSGIEEHLLTVRELLNASFQDHQSGDASVSELNRLAKEMDLQGLLDRAARHLSNGEIRKTLLVQALLRQPEFLILDEPFDGLDKESSGKFSHLVSRIIENGTPLLLITHRFSELVSQITHILCLKDGRAYAQGSREEMLELVHKGKLFEDQFHDTGTNEPKPPLISSKRNNEANENKKNGIHSNMSSGEAVILMKDIQVLYEEKTILKDLNWTVLPGENWKICGPNGAGKSTLLSLITGDHLQAYANDIKLFGKQRGEGESVWDIKQKLGIVTAELQVHYRQPISSLKVVLSGFFDSIGLYRPASEEQKQVARMWLDRLGQSELAEQDFLKLSQGQQRMMLVARAMVKSPPLLILDEPCQGLDPTYRGMLLELIDQIGMETSTQLIYVTHVEEDNLECIHCELHFESDQQGGQRIHVKRTF